MAISIILVIMLLSGTVFHLYKMYGTLAIKLYVSSIFFVFAFALGGGTGGLVATLIIGVFVIVSIICREKKHKEVLSKKKAQKAIEEKKALEEKKKQFYLECKNANIDDCSTEREIEKATLIARRLELPVDNITFLFNQAKTVEEKRAQEDHRREIDKKKAEERKECYQIEKYSDLSGREKRIAMLTHRRNEILEKIRILQGGTSAVMSATQQKEIDWATHAGIASGIAGGAAGLATAIELQGKNAQIRAQNAASRELAARFSIAIDEELMHYKKDVDWYNKQIEESKVKLVEDHSSQKYFEHLIFSDTQISVSETGTCAVKTVVKLKAPVYIYGNTEAVVDGTITAGIYDGENQIGGAIMVFPTFGLNYIPNSNTRNRNYTCLEGLLLFRGEKGKKYTVKFEPRHLWLIER